MSCAPITSFLFGCRAQLVTLVIMRLTDNNFFHKIVYLSFPKTKHALLYSEIKPGFCLLSQLGK